MATGNHVHEWQYNEAEKIMYPSAPRIEWEVVRFCKKCFKLENIKLEDHDSQGK